jgi:hypothetical protein
VVCPIQNAWELHKAWPHRSWLISPNSGPLRLRAR